MRKTALSRNISVINCSAIILSGKDSYAKATTKAETAVIGAVGPDACSRVPPKIEVIIGIMAAPTIPANAHSARHCTKCGT